MKFASPECGPRRARPRAPFLLLALAAATAILASQETPAPSPVNERTPSRALYRDWLNGDWHGSGEEKVMSNLEFFRWLHDEYGMELDYYLLDAGNLDQGPACNGGEEDLAGLPAYGTLDSALFTRKFPVGIGPLADAAASLGCRLGLWLGPDGFGDTPQEARKRFDLLTSLCRDFRFALFTFDACCSRLRAEKENDFAQALEACRRFVPDLITIHRGLPLSASILPQLTAGGREGPDTYVDVSSCNTVTAPHHRAASLALEPPANLQRLIEDPGVCLSSYLDGWEDELILQTFNRSALLSPLLYGNPWLLRDDELARLAAICNLFRRFRDILVDGQSLPEGRYGPGAASRGNGKQRFVTMRNLSWMPVKRRIKLDGSLGLAESNSVEVRQYHPSERLLGRFIFGSEAEVTIPPFRVILVEATTDLESEWAVTGCDYEVVRDMPGKPVEVKLLGWPGHKLNISLLSRKRRFRQAKLNGVNAYDLLKGEKVSITFPGTLLRAPWHRRLLSLERIAVPAPEESEQLQEAAHFAADSNALEVRSLQRSGPSRHAPVEKARQAFFESETFVAKGGWDRFAFDGRRDTAFKVRRYLDRDGTYSLAPGLLRLDMGMPLLADTLILSGLEPRYQPEYAEVSADLFSWRRAATTANAEGTLIHPDDGQPFRYLRLTPAPLQVAEIEALYREKVVNRSSFRASNLFPAPRTAAIAWAGSLLLDEIPPGSILAVAVDGTYGPENALAVIRTRDRRLIGAPDRAPGYPSNHWAHFPKPAEGHYTFYFHLGAEMVGQPLEVIVLGFGLNMESVVPEIWLTATPSPQSSLQLTLGQ